LKAEVINKIIISDEAVFDYTEALGLGVLDRRTLKAEVEEYIDRMNRTDRLKHEGYFRCNYLDDEESGRMLMLFITKAEKVSIIQSWDLIGICFTEDWTEDIEADGQIRCWLKSKVKDLPDIDDWVVNERANKIIRDTEKTLYVNVLEEVRSAFDNKRDKKAAEKLLLLQKIHFISGKRKHSQKKNKRD